MTPRPGERWLLNGRRVRVLGVKDGTAMVETRDEVKGVPVGRLKPDGYHGKATTAAGAR
jgi:hypothetical protein